MIRSHTFEAIASIPALLLHTTHNVSEFCGIILSTASEAASNAPTPPAVVQNPVVQIRELCETLTLGFDQFVISIVSCPYHTE